MSQYTELFPDSALAKLLIAYFLYHGIHLDGTPADHGSKLQDSEEDIAAVIMVCTTKWHFGKPVDNVQDMLSSVGNSVIGHRIVGETYQIEEDYENAIQVAENGLELLHSEEMKRGVKLESYVVAKHVFLQQA